MTTSTATAKQKAYAPGARVEIRDEEWIVRSVKPATFGGQAVHVVGMSELVRNKDAIFLTELDSVRELLPEETKLVHDDSPQYRKSRLYLESLLRRSPATDDALYVGHRGAILPTEYQLQPAAKALRQVRPRILMADGVGLGKTIEVGVLLSELIQRGRADRILVVALKSILSQFQKELWARFTIPLVRLDSVGIQRVQSRIPSNMNPFYYYDRAIISIDTLKRDEKYRRYLEESHWDVIVVDECQHVAVRNTGSKSQQSQRARLAQLLARTTDALILTSATPHDGKPESFASLMNLLEPTAVADESDYTNEEIREYYLRRFKKDIRHEVEEAFPEREVSLDKHSASVEEDAVFSYLSKVAFYTIDSRRRSKGVLFRTLLLKAFLSSPAACIATIESRLAHKDLEDETKSDVAHDRGVLSELKALAQAVSPKQFPKLQALLQILKGLGLDRAECRERVVVFSERIATLKFLEEYLKKELKLKSQAIEVFHGSLGDQDQQSLVETFGTEHSPIRILLASDVASEGINLHYYCHRLVHFDLPWSLITLEQRNGRIDRFGQTQTPEITCLLTVPGNPKLQGDLRVLELLIEREQNAHKNLGDVAWLLNLHDAEKEEDRIAMGIQEGESAEAVIPDEEEVTDFMALLMGDDADGEPSPKTGDPVRLFASDLLYAREAFNEVLGSKTTAVEWHDHLQGMTVHPPDDLLRRFDLLPPELINDNELKLTVDRSLVMKALENAREDEQKWPEWQLFWERHPIAEWMADRVLGEFARHEAPMLRVAKGLDGDEAVVLFQGMVSSRRSQPIIVDWFGVHFRGKSFAKVVPIEELLEATGLTKATANPGGGLDAETLERLASLLGPATAKAKERMQTLRKERMKHLGADVRDGLRKLKEWRDRRIEQLNDRRKAILAKGRGLRRDQERRLANEHKEVEKRYSERQEWIDQGLRTIEEPYLRVAGVLIPLDRN